MKIKFIAIATLLGAARVNADPLSLSSAALDRVVAGGASDSSATDDARTSVVATDESRIDIAAHRRVIVNDAAQADARALNAVNAAHADAVNSLNLLNGSALQTRQTNVIEQRAGGGAHAELIERQGDRRIVRSGREGAFDASSRITSFNEHVLNTHTSRSTFDSFNANVPAYNPLQNLTITLGTPKLPTVKVPEFGFDLTTTDDVGGVYGVRGHLGPFTFDPPQVVLGTVQLSGNDVVIRGGFVDLPSLDLGSATVDFCAVKCGGVNVDLPTIDGPRVDFGNEFRIKDANPFKDVRINAGGGLSVAGKGHIAVDLGHVRLGASLSLQIPDLKTNFSFDVLGHTVNTGDFGIHIPAIEASVDLIDADIGVAYSADFDGALCLSIVTTRCDGLEHHERAEEARNDVTRTTSSAVYATSGGARSFGAETIVAGARMSGAEADLIAMSEGNVNLDAASLVQLDAQAQRRMKVFNAVNASGALIGNTVNVGATAAVSGGTLAQSNTFLQFQTRPRGR